MSEARTVRYEGPPPFVSALAQSLREEGVRVDYTPPMERKSAVDLAETVAVAILCNGTYDAIKYGVKRFTESRLGRSARVEIEDDKGE